MDNVRIPFLEFPWNPSSPADSPPPTPQSQFFPEGVTENAYQYFCPMINQEENSKVPCVVNLTVEEFIKYMKERTEVEEAPSEETTSACSSNIQKLCDEKTSNVNHLRQPETHDKVASNLKEINNKFCKFASAILENVQTKREPDGLQCERSVKKRLSCKKRKVCRHKCKSSSLEKFSSPECERYKSQNMSLSKKKSKSRRVYRFSRSPSYYRSPTLVCKSRYKCSRSPRRRRSTSKHFYRSHSRSSFYSQSPSPRYWPRTDDRYSRSSSRSPLRRRFELGEFYRSYSRSPSRCWTQSPTSEYSKSPSPAYRSRTDDKYSKENHDLSDPEHFNESEMLQCTGNGTYYCKYCDATINSDITWDTHLSGKRHAKNVRQHNLHKVVLSTVSSQIFTRYPPPPAGMKRIKTSDIAEIQYIIDDLKPVCPGADSVIEIHSSSRKSYYCELCDAPCSADTILPHMTGIKHYMRCLKVIDPEFHDILERNPRVENKRRMERIFVREERKKGRGRVRVEKDVPAERNAPKHTLSWKKRKIKEEPKDIAAITAPEVIPDTSKNVFYCPTCDSHMNNGIIWNSHIRGKRHLKNLKRDPREKPSGTKFSLCKQARPKLIGHLRNIKSPVVGLDFIRETQNPEAGEMYNCFLCGACCASDIVDHILTVKHRIKYLKKIENPHIEGILRLEVANTARSNLIEEECQKAEKEYGRGRIEVYVKTA